MNWIKFEVEIDEEIGLCIDIYLGPFTVTIHPQSWSLDFRHLGEYVGLGLVTIGFFGE